MRSPTPRLCRFIVVVLAAALAAGAAHAGKLFKWVDANGVTHYSDVPADGAQTIDVEGAQSYHAPAPRGTAPLPGAKPAAAPAAGYAALAITAPVEGAVLWNEDGRIAVAASVEPGLAGGHQLWFELDGTRIEASGTSAEVPAPRGEHSLAAVVTDAAGTELQRSAPVSFVVRQNTTVRPPQGPALPKKPRA